MAWTRLRWWQGREVMKQRDGEEEEGESELVLEQWVTSPQKIRSITNLGQFVHQSLFDSLFTSTRIFFCFCFTGQSTDLDAGHCSYIAFMHLSSLQFLFMIYVETKLINASDFRWFDQIKLTVCLRLAVASHDWFLCSHFTTAVSRGGKQHQY